MGCYVRGNKNGYNATEITNSILSTLDFYLFTLLTLICLQVIILLVFWRIEGSLRSILRCQGINFGGLIRSFVDF